MHIRGGLFPANIVERFIWFRVGGSVVSDTG